MAETGQDVAAVMSAEQLEAYHEELKEELMQLEHAQSLHPSDYKMERINRLRQRLNLPKI